MVRTEGLGKRYRLGLIHHDRLADAVTHGVRSAARGMRRLLGRGRAPAATAVDSAGQGRGLSREPDHIWALRNVNLEITRGEVVGIIGRNGAGKSTLLKILTGITEPTEGRAWLKGRIGSLLEVGTGFHPELTGRENVILNGAILGMTRREMGRKLDEIVAFAEVERFVDTPVKRYSSGMYVRLAFAVAAHLEPDILVVDEVLAVGDNKFQVKCIAKMDEAARTGRTILFVSHQMHAIAKLCTRAIVLESGRVTRQGEAADMVEYYMNLSRQGNESSRLSRPRPAARSEEAAARFTACRLLNRRGEAVTSSANDEPLILEAEYEVFKDLEDVYSTVQIRASDDTVVLTSIQGDWESARGLETSGAKTPGAYRLRVTLPGRLLNSGRYYAVFRLIEPRVRQHDSMAGEFIDIRDHGTYSTAVMGSSRPGYLAIALKHEVLPA